jgi:hypothetical protein
MTPTLSVAQNGSNNVLMTVYGDPNATVTMYYNTSYGIQSAYLGITNNSGYFSSNVNASSYNIMQNGTVYVTVNGQQSTAVIWPMYNSYYPYGNTYSNVAGLNISNLVLSVGNSITVSSTNGSNLYVSSNSNPNVASASNGTSGTTVGCYGNALYSVITGQPCYNQYNQNYYQNTSNTSVTITALAYGSDTITLCQGYNSYNYSNACNTISLTVNNTNSAYVTPGNVLGASTFACPFYRTLRYGMSGQDVECLRTYLTNKGYLSGYGNYGSYFDLQLRNAVVSFQQSNGLYADGVVGVRTQSFMY